MESAILKHICRNARGSAVWVFVTFVTCSLVFFFYPVQVLNCYDARYCLCWHLGRGFVHVQALNVRFVDAG